MGQDRASKSSTQNASSSRRQARAKRRQSRLSRSESSSAQSSDKGSTRDSSLLVDTWPDIIEVDLQSQCNRGGRPKKLWIPSRERLFVRFVTSTFANLALLEQTISEDGFRASLKHLQNKVRDMFGPRISTEPGYQAHLRPENAAGMEQRVFIFIQCKMRWYSLAGYNTPLDVTHQLTPWPFMSHNQSGMLYSNPLTLEGNIKYSFDYQWAWGIATKDEELTGATKNADRDPAPCLREPRLGLGVVSTVDNGGFGLLAASSLRRSSSSRSSLDFDSLSIGSTSQDTYSSSGSQSSFQLPSNQIFPRHIPKISRIKRFLRFKKGLFNDFALSTLSLEEASITLKKHGIDSSGTEDDFYRICFTLTSNLCSIPSEVHRMHLLKKQIEEQRGQIQQWRRLAAARISEFEKNTKQIYLNDRSCWPPQAKDESLWICIFCLSHCPGSCLMWPTIVWPDISQDWNSLNRKKSYLHVLASMEPTLESLTVYIKMGVDIHQVNLCGESFLHVLDPSQILLQSDHFLQLLSFLKDRQFNFESVDTSGQNPLHRIVCHPRWSCCPRFHDPRQPGAEAILLIKAIDLISNDQNQFRILRFRDAACGTLFRHLVLLGFRLSTPKPVRRLISSFVRAHCGESVLYDEFGSSLLHRATGLGVHELVKILLALGADPWEENDLGMDPAVYGWGFLEVYHDDAARYADVWLSMQHVLDKQQELGYHTRSRL